MIVLNVWIDIYVVHACERYLCAYELCRASVMVVV